MNHSLPRHPDGEGTGTLRAHPERDLITEPKAKEFRSLRTRYRTNSGLGRKGSGAFPGHIQPILSTGTVWPGPAREWGLAPDGARCGQTRSVYNDAGTVSGGLASSRAGLALTLCIAADTYDHPVITFGFGTLAESDQPV